MSKLYFKQRKGRNNQVTIYLQSRIFGDNNIIRVSTHIKMPLNQWNQKQEKARETKQFPTSRFINQQLAEWRLAYETTVQKLHEEEIHRSREHFVQYLQNLKQGKPKIDSTNNLVEFFDLFIQNREMGESKASSIKSYRNALNHIISFDGENILFQDITEEWILRFFKFLKVNKKHSNTTINKIQRRLNTVLKEAKNKGYNVKDDFKLNSLKVRAEKQAKIYLSEDEIDQIRRLDVKGTSLEKVKDLFILGYRTGQRFSDFINITSKLIFQDQGKDFLRIKSQKTQIPVIIPLSNEVREVLNKYNGKTIKISDVYFNRQLKVLAEKAGIDSNVVVYTKGKPKSVRKYTLVSSHICRRSFATNGYLNNVSEYDLMKITGHKGVKQFRDYICVDAQEIAQKVGEHSFMQ